MKTAQEWFDSRDGYTIHSEDQIRDESLRLIAAIQADAIESAAKVCYDESERLAKRRDSFMPEAGWQQYDYASSMVGNCALAIDALLQKAKP